MEEYQQVPVHGANLRYAASQLGAMGVPFQVAGQQGGVYIILVPMPYAPQVAGAPWAYQQPPAWNGLRRLPLVPVLLLLLLLVGGWFALQAVGVGGLAISLGAPAPTERAAEEGGGLVDKLTAALDGLAAVPERIDAEVERRRDEAKQEIGEAVTSMVIGAVALPLTAIAVLGAGWFAFRMYRRGKA